MATNLVQSSQLSPIPGSAGQQSVVQDRSPTAGQAMNTLLERATQAYDTAGTIYSKNAAQSLVKEELENIDSAIATAEKGQEDEDFIKPETLPVSDDEFTLIENAVRNGGMSREKARLLASSRLRTRISEEPFFADKLRRAASNVVGFNIQSEPAQQYFAAFKTEAQIRGDGQTQEQKWMDQALAIQRSMPGVSLDAIYNQIAQEAFASTQKDLFKARKEAGLINSEQEFTEANQANAEVDFGAVLGSFKAAFEENGSVDEQAAKAIIAQAKNTRYRELDKIFDDHTSTEYQRARQAIDDRFDGYLEFVNSVGFDTLNELKIERARDARTMLGDKLFMLEKTVSENLGSDVFSQAMDMFTNITDPAQLETMLQGLPTVGKVGAILGNPVAVKSFGNQVASIYENMATGAALNGTDRNSDTGLTQEEVADLVFREAFQAGGKSEESVIEYLKQQGLETKPVSLLTQQAPGRVSNASRQYFSTMYETALPEKTEQLGTILAQNPELEWSIEPNGRITIDPPRAGDPRGPGGGRIQTSSQIARQERAYDQAQELLNHINLYADGIDKGWGTVVKASPSLHRKKISETLDQGWKQESQRQIIEARDLVWEGNMGVAEETFNNLKRIDPALEGISFRTFRNRVLARRRQMEQPQQEQ